MKKLAISAAIIVVIGLLFAYFQYNKPHRDVAGESAAFQVSVGEIMTEFTQDELQAYNKYFEKVGVISGKLTSVSQGGDQLINLLLEHEGQVANCQLSPHESMEFWNDRLDQPVTLKGLFIGYDDLLAEVQFKECSYYGKQP